MTAPVRLQLSRRKGFDLQAHSQAINGLPAVNVARPTAWGNPFVVGKDGTREECVRWHTFVMGGYLVVTDNELWEAQKASQRYVRENVDQLRGKNLACWCHLDGKPCHADTLLEIAATFKAEEVKL